MRERKQERKRERKKKQERKSEKKSKREREKITKRERKKATRERIADLAINSSLRETKICPTIEPRDLLEHPSTISLTIHIGAR